MYVQYVRMRVQACALVTGIRKTSYLQEEVFLTEALWHHEEGGRHSTLQVGHQSGPELSILILQQHFYLRGNTHTNQFVNLIV